VSREKIPFDEKPLVAHQFTAKDDSEGVKLNSLFNLPERSISSRLMPVFGGFVHGRENNFPTKLCNNKKTATFF
jgi:hypothetical protein